MDCSPPGSSVHGISQTRILQWVAISSSRVLPNPGIKPMSPVFPALAGGFFTIESLGKLHILPFTACYFLSNFCFVVRISFLGSHSFSSFQLGEIVCTFKLNFNYDLVCETSSKSSRQYGKCAINLVVNSSTRDAKMNKLSTD